MASGGHGTLVGDAIGEENRATGRADAKRPCDPRDLCFAFVVPMRLETHLEAVLLVVSKPVERRFYKRPSA